MISPGKSDILQYYGGRIGRTDVAYVVQPHSSGLCDAIFRARPLIHPDESVAVGLPDTIWFPRDGLLSLPRDRLAFLLFPVARPQLFDAVVTDTGDRVREIQVKAADASSQWVWGAFSMPGRVYHELYDFWHGRGEREGYVGTLVNAWLAQGGEALGVRAGQQYVDVGTLHGYREAIRLLAGGAGAARKQGRVSHQA